MTKLVFGTNLRIRNWDINVDPTLRKNGIHCASDQAMTEITLPDWLIKEIASTLWYEGYIHLGKSLDEALHRDYVLKVTGLKE